MVKKYSIMFYQEEKQLFLQIYVSHPKFIAQLRSTLEKGVQFCGQHEALSDITYESNMPYALRFMIDNEIGGMTWVRIQKGQWQIRPKSRKETLCQIEFDVENFNNVECLPCEGQY
jgi:DNA polymerase delta subunit 1